MPGKLTPEELEAEGLSTGAPTKLTPEELEAEGLTTKPKPDAPFLESDSMWNPLPSKEVRAQRQHDVEALVPQATQKIRSALNSATYGFAPKIVGALEGDEEAEATKKTYSDAVRDQPEANKVGTLLAPFPGSGSLKGPLKYLAQAGIGAATSGAQAYNASKAPTVSERLGDAAVPALIGGVAAPVAGAVASGASKLAARFSGRATEIGAEALAKDLATMRASASGKLGQSVQDSNRALINIKEAASNPNVSQDLREQAANFLASPEGAALAEQVGKNTLEAAPEKLGRMADLKDKLAQVPAEAAAKNKKMLDTNTLSPSGAAGSRLTRYVSAGLGGFAGGAVGKTMEDSGMLPDGYGTSVGAAMGASLGRPGGSLANLMKHPQFASQWRNVMARALEEGGAALVRFGHTGAQLAAIDSAEERAKAVEKLAETPQGAADIKAGLEEDPVRKRFGG